MRIHSVSKSSHFFRRVLPALGMLLAITTLWSAPGANSANQPYIIEEKLDRQGEYHIKKGDIKISGLDLARPNFLLTVFVQAGDYWVTSRAFIDKDGIKIEGPPSLRGKLFRVVIWLPR